jgi:hypothetical protein
MSIGIIIYCGRRYQNVHTSVTPFNCEFQQVRVILLGVLVKPI